MTALAPIVMPKLGLTMTEGLLATWRVAPGDAVQIGDILFVVETEKIATEIEAQQSGQIGKLLVPEGETVAVGTIVAQWAQAEASRPDNGPPDAAAPAPRRPEKQIATSATMRVVATPLARRVARQNGIDIARIAGTGPNGRIKALDVKAAIADRPSTAAKTNLVAETGQTIRRPAKAIEKVIARRLSQSKQTIPHFYVLAEAEVTRLMAVRDELNGGGAAPRLSITHFIVAAVGRSLLAMPDCNVLWDDEDIVTPGTSDVGIATNSERGLLVPVLRDAGRLALDEVGQGCRDLVDRARSGRLAADELEGGTISVSNVGMFGASYLVPIINPGQSAILGVAAEKAVFRPDSAGAPVLHREIGLTLACDHRVFDGVTATRFLDHIVELLAHPLQLLRSPAIERAPS